MENINDVYDKETMIKCVAISDTHNKTDEYQVPDGDILFHSGDFSM